MPAKKTGKAGLARRYATALFELAKQEGALDAVARDVSGLAAALAASSELTIVAKSPVLPVSEVTAAFTQLLEDAKANTLTVRTIQLLAQNRRLPLIPAVAETFQRLLSAERGEVTVEVTSAAPLSAQHKSALEATLKKAVGRQVALKEYVNQNILGGLKVKLGSELIDASVEGRLERLARAQKTANSKG